MANQRLRDCRNNWRILGMSCKEIVLQGPQQTSSHQSPPTFFGSSMKKKIIFGNEAPSGPPQPSRHVCSVKYQRTVQSISESYFKVEVDIGHRCKDRRPSESSGRRFEASSFSDSCHPKFANPPIPGLLVAQLRGSPLLA
jgi:hypothetical protein